MRLIVMGGAVLCEGFTLLGFESYPNASTVQMENLLAELLKNKEKALIFVEDYLTREPQANFLQVRGEASGIIITEIPALNTPENYHPTVEALVMRVLGGSALDKN
ncbi:MAG: V-type ATP synthase subunit F [Thiotrichaceae bacterium]|nr:V-type ATP synthase subunit F [Thiotrichaceae bacterium]